MPPTTRRASAAQNASTTSDDAQAASDGVRRREEGGGDEGGKKRKTSCGTEEGEADEVGTRRDFFFSTLPLDLFYQICGQLHPGTLLAIAQTSKSIRSTLFRKSAAPVWHAARRSAGLDALSGKLDEPTYAYLLYGKACQVCGTTKWDTTGAFDLQVRACAKCLETNICLASTIEDEIDDLHPLTFQCCLSTPFSHKGKRSVSRKPFYWKPEVVATSALLHEVDPVAARTDRRKTRPSQAALDLKRAFDDYASVIEADSKVFSDCAQRATEQMLQDERDRPIWRLKQLQIRLMAEGFAEEDTVAIPECFKNSSTFVDDTYWANIKNRVIRAAQRVRGERMNRERLQRKEGLQTLYADLYRTGSTAEQDFFPSIEAFWRLPSVETLWSPEDAVNDAASWSAATPAIRLDIQHQARVDKIRYFHRLARALAADGIALPTFVADLLSAEPSAFLDENNESKGLAPLHDQLTDDQLHELLYRPLAVFSCGAFCRSKSFLVSKVGLHLQQYHAGRQAYSATSAEKSIQPVRTSRLEHLDRFLRRLGLSSLKTTADELEKLPAGFEVRFDAHNGDLLQRLKWSELISHSDSFHNRRVYAIMYVDPTIVDKKVRAKVRRAGGSKLPTQVSTSGGTSS